MSDAETKRGHKEGPEPRPYASKQALASPRVIGAFLVILTLAIFGRLINSEFITLNDPEYVTANVHVQQGLAAKSIGWAFSSMGPLGWHPVAWVSHMADVTLFGEGPAGPHLINVALHTANVGLLFWLLATMTAAFWRSAFVAALFALHPLHVESVAWISERKGLLSALFALLAVLAYAKYSVLHRPKPKSDQASESSPPTVGEQSSAQLRLSSLRSRPWAFFVLALVFFALGLMSSAAIVALPVLLLLLDFWPLERLRPQEENTPDIGPHHARPFSRLFIEKIPFFLLSAATVAISMSGYAKSQAGPFLAGRSFPAWGANALVAYARYISKTFWPEDLALPYPHPAQWPVSEVVLAAALIIALSGAALWRFRRLPFLFVGWFWFLILLAPMTGLAHFGSPWMADHFTYLPLVGLFVALAWGGARLLRRLDLPEKSGLVAALLALTSCAAFTVHQLGYWQNSERLFTHTLAVTQNNYVAQLNLGAYLYDKGRLDEAASHLAQALEIQPDDPVALNRMGSIWARRKNFAQALQYYQAALRVQPDFTDAHNNLGVAYRNLGRTEDAIREYREALRGAPDNSEAHNNLANLLVAQGNIDQAIIEYRLALRANPRLIEALNNLGLVLADKGQVVEAVNSYRKALDIKPQDPALHENYGDLLARMGKNQDSARQYRQALLLSPNDPEAHFGLGRALARLGWKEEAKMHLKEAVRLNPNDAEAKRELQSLEQPTLR
jgi:tetratricopeptide (TPR) repeat protein